MKYETLVAPDVGILLVDDDSRNLDVLESILETPEYRLVRAQSAEDALKALVTQEFALIVLDVRMPDMGGLELAQLIKQRKKTQHLPIIFLTAYYQEDEQILQGYDVGAVDYLNKPCNPAILRSKVAAFVNLYRVNRALKEEIAERRQAEMRLAEREAEVQTLVSQLRALATELLQTEHRERKRLASILHDSVQQLLVSAKMRLSSMRPDSPYGAVQEVVAEVDSLIKDALSVSRSLTVELSPPVLQEAGLAAGLQWLAKYMADQHRFKVTVFAENDAEARTDGERSLLFECIRELLFNAVKHSGVKEATLRLTGEDDQIKVVVEDAGTGFDPELLQRRIEEQGSFGLFSIQQRLMHLGGIIEIDSAPGAGARVTLRAPRGKVAEKIDKQNGALRPIIRAGQIRSELNTGPISILVVDDHKIVRDCLVGLLRLESDVIVVGEAEDGPHAIELAGKLNPDVILMDMNLGVMTGLEVTRIILSNNPEGRVIGLSMHAEKHIAEAMLKAGAVAYLTKDVALEELLGTIKASVANKR